MSEKPKRPRKQRADLKCAEAWRSFHAGEGRAALAALFTEFNLYHPEPSNDPHAVMRATGQRDVLLRITQLVGLRPEHFPETAWQDAGAIEQLFNART